RRAIFLIPELTSLEKGILEKAQTAPLDGEVHRLVERAESALAEWKRGTALPQHDWGVSLANDGFDRLAQLEIQTDLICKLVMLRARLGFRERRNREAVDDLMAIISTGRHLASCGP